MSGVFECRQRGPRRAAALVSAVLLLVILAALTASFLGAQTARFSTERAALDRLRADAAAHGGLHLAQWRLRNDSDLLDALARPVLEDDTSLTANPLLKFNGTLAGAAFVVDVWPSPTGARFRSVATAGRSQIERWTEIPTTVSECYRQLVMSYNPVAYWRLSETSGVAAADEIATYPGTYVNSVSLGAPENILCENSSAAAFDGVNDAVTLGSPNISGNRMSIIAWIRADRFDHLANRDGTIIAKASGSATSSHYWSLTTVKSGSRTRLRFALRAGGSVKTKTAGGAGNLVANRWYLVAATYDGSRMRLYVNGAAAGNTRKSGNIDTSGSVAAWIGDIPPSSGARPFDGIIDEVAIFNVALSGQQIAALYAAASIPP